MHLLFRAHFRCSDIDLFSEFAITVTIPAIGLLLIFAAYKARLAMSSDGKDDLENDGGTEQQALFARRARDWAAWTAIGWLFLVYTILCRCVIFFCEAELIDVEFW